MVFLFLLKFIVYQKIFNIRANKISRTFSLVTPSRSLFFQPTGKKAPRSVRQLLETLTETKTAGGSKPDHYVPVARATVFTSRFRKEKVSCGATEPNRALRIHFFFVGCTLWHSHLDSIAGGDACIINPLKVEFIFLCSLFFHCFRFVFPFVLLFLMSWMLDADL